MVKSLSVFFPAYNEEGNIALTVEKAAEVLKKLNIEWEILVINDGSKDQTQEIAEKVASRLDNVSVINQPNGGYGMALRGGFHNAKYDWIAYTDGDGQFDLSEIDKFIKLSGEADYVIGYRIKRSDPFYRLIFAKTWALSVYLLFGIWVKDIDCGFKMISRKVLDGITALESTRGAMINAELLIKAKNSGFRVAQVGVNHYPRRAGVPTGANIKVIIRSYLDLFNLWLKLR